MPFNTNLFKHSFFISLQCGGLQTIKKLPCLVSLKINSLEQWVVKRKISSNITSNKPWHDALKKKSFHESSELFTLWIILRHNHNKIENISLIIGEMLMKMKVCNFIIIQDFHRIWVEGKFIFRCKIYSRYNPQKISNTIQLRPRLDSSLSLFCFYFEKNKCKKKNKRWICSQNVYSFFFYPFYRFIG